MASSTASLHHTKKRTIATVTRLLGPSVVSFWRWKEKGELPSTDRQFSPNVSDNVQQAMNLVMPLADPSAIGRARLVEMLASAADEVVAGLHNTGIVHFARFTIVDGNLVMFSIYDGDFANYIRDFIYNIGSFFDDLMHHVSAPSLVPVEDYPDAFVQWVRDRDAFQLGEDVTALSDNLEALPRALVLALDPKRHHKSEREGMRNDVQIFVYRAYPKVTVAQIRHALKMGW